MSRIVLGITGSVAAYKGCHLCRELRAAGHLVRVVMTASARRFVGRATLQALSGHAVHDDLWDPTAEGGMAHIELARWAERVLIAPASADTLARLAQGRADDVLTTLCLATTAPVTVAPAMNWRMWEHPATRANVALLVSRGVTLLGPDVGLLAEGESGPGRMLEPEAIVAALVDTGNAGALHGRRVLVSAGPTYEDIDPVRFIGNRSSGRMGFAVAAAAVAAGARVTLVAGPVSLPTPAGVTERIDVRSARQMLEAMTAHAAAADIVVAAAAVADYRPRTQAGAKLKKSLGTAGTELALVENPDILHALAALRPRPFLVGFAAETERLAEYARAKLAAKGLDMIAANLVGEGRGFDAPRNALDVYWADGHTGLPEQPKPDLAAALVALIARRHAATAEHAS